MGAANKKLPLLKGLLEQTLVNLDNAHLGLIAHKLRYWSLRAQNPSEQQPSCGLAVVLRDGRRIEVQRDFDGHTFERLMSALERV